MAQSDLGYAYHHGEGVVYDEALRLYKLAARAHPLLSAVNSSTKMRVVRAILRGAADLGTDARADPRAVRTARRRRAQCHPRPKPTLARCTARCFRSAARPACGRPGRAATSGSASAADAHEAAPRVRICQLRRWTVYRITLLQPFSSTTPLPSDAAVQFKEQARFPRSQGLDEGVERPGDKGAPAAEQRAPAGRRRPHAGRHRADRIDGVSEDGVLVGYPVDRRRSPITEQNTGPRPRYLDVPGFKDYAQLVVIYGFGGGLPRTFLAASYRGLVGGAYA